MELSHWGRKSIGCPWLVLQIYDRSMMGNLGYLLAVKSLGFKPASLIAHRFGGESAGKSQTTCIGCVCQEAARSTFLVHCNMQTEMQPPIEICPSLDFAGK